MGGKKLADTLHADMFKALAARPQGAVVRVFSIYNGFILLFSILAAHKTLSKHHKAGIEDHGICQHPGGEKTKSRRHEDPERAQFCKAVQGMEG